MQKFYVFLDIDGVLWDWEWRKQQILEGNILQYGAISDFNPESMYSLNLLINTLSKNFDVNLVISSTWRLKFDDTKHALFSQGLKYNGEIYKTKILESRQVEIEEFLKNKNENENFVVIDDEVLNFDCKNYIRTNIQSGSLKVEQVMLWLKNFAKENENTK